MKQSEWNNPKLYVLCSQDKGGNFYTHAWSKEEVPKNTVKRLVSKHPEDVKYLCLPWWRFYDSKSKVKKDLPCFRR